MKKVIICGSIAVADAIIKAKDELEARGFVVEIPWGVHRYIEAGNKHVAESERVQAKKEHDLIKRYFELIKEYDAVLVVNADKNGKENYIGGNTFLEMGFAHVLNKPLYVLNPLPDVSYRSELDAMKPMVLDGDLNNFPN